MRRREYHIICFITWLLFKLDTLQTKEVSCIGYCEFRFLHSYAGERIGAMIPSLIWTDLRIWITGSTGVVRDWAVLTSFISMDLIYEILTVHGIFFLMFSILKLSHPVTNALELLSFLEVPKLHVITFFLFSYIKNGRNCFRLSQKLLTPVLRAQALPIYVFHWSSDQGLNLRRTTFKAIMPPITQMMWFRCSLYLFLICFVKSLHLITSNCLRSNRHLVILAHILIVKSAFTQIGISSYRHIAFCYFGTRSWSSPHQY